MKSSDKIVMWEKPFNSKMLHREFKQRVDRKPDGIWYACGKEWIDWVEAEMPAWKSPHIYKLKLDMKSILKINTLEKLKKFSDTYLANAWNIDWINVSRFYAGIEICPYQYKVRYDLKWYYTWDVASGCIWDPSVIEEVSSLR